jgi:predicted MFS family arabinose efflux permease
MSLKVFSLYRKSISGFSPQIWLLSLVTFINRSGTMVIPFLSVYMTIELGFSIVEAGWVLLCFGLGSLAGSYLGGYLTDKIGYYWVMFWSLFGGGLMFIMLGFVDTIVLMGLIVFLTSTIADALRPAVMTAIAVYSKPENRTRAFSLIRMAINFGWAMGPAIGGWLVSYKGYWTLFWADGLTCMAAALIFVFFMKAKKVEKEQEVSMSTEPSQSPYRDKEYLFFLFLTLIGAIVFMQFLYTLPVFYKEKLEFSEMTIGNILALNGLLIAFTEMPLVYTLERKLKAIDNIWIGVSMYGIAYIMLNLAVGSSFFIAITSMIILSIGEMFNMPFTNTFAISRASEENRGAYMGLFTMTYSLAHIIGPPLGTQTVHHFGFEALWNLMGAMSLVATIGFLYLKKRANGRAAFPKSVEVELTH